MKKVLALSSVVSAYLSVAPFTFAQVNSGSLCPTGTFNPLCNPTIGNVIGPLIQFIFILAVIAALIYLVWGGFKWLISGGDKTALQTAREHIVAAIIGLVIIFLSYFILNLIISVFIPGFNLSGFTLPHIGG